MKRPARRSMAAAWLCLTLATGCGGVSVSPGTQTTEGGGPNGGTMFALPDGKGYVELIQDAGERGKRNSVGFKAYFLGADKKSPIAAAPTAVSINLKTPTGPRTIKMSSSGGPREFAGKGAFAADRIAGELSATIDGQGLKLPIELR